MMRKFFVTMMLAVAIVFIGSQAEAREVYVGSYSDGTDVYLLTESISMGRPSPSGLQFTCQVRAGGDYLNYRFYGVGYNMYNRRMRYENSEGYSGYVDSSSPVAAAIYSWVSNHQ